MSTLWFSQRNLKPSCYIMPLPKENLETITSLHNPTGRRHRILAPMEKTIRWQKSQKAFGTSVAITLWCIWMERSNRIFCCEALRQNPIVNLIPSRGLDEELKRWTVLQLSLQALLFHRIHPILYLIYRSYADPWEIESIASCFNPKLYFSLFTTTSPIFYLRIL